ncbi:glutathione ABC transporter permease GsiD [Desulfosarcina ovata subsp. sediminis]|uniref:Glutathione ABC transporter permease GsiD n=1 Tax=Desulfosarcina ovata subsp. sediminis TaxID=885957 RepID=A0A5K7ZJR6_9BACT|nr:ABC transporter permease [Desulfosarcina ovata]BBO82402.1 glutathione ABC transporter permease GsiD [Desulfosarcina ovata subsp. sediminis]
MKVLTMRNRPLIACVIFFSALILWGLGRDPVTMTLSLSLSPPSPSLPFGSDHLGRDILARVAHGFFWDISLSLSVVFASALIGVLLGLVCAYAGGWVDHLLTLVMDVVLSLPHIVLAMVLMLYLSYNPTGLIIALVLPGWVKYSRIIRAQVMALKNVDFILCEKVLGAGFTWICLRHLLPNVILPVVGLAALHMGHTLLSVASLGFLGLGLQPPAPEWGAMIMEAQPYIMRAPWTAVFPGLFIFAYILVFTLVGRALEKGLQNDEEGLRVIN